jgi:hypothetical protein
MQKSDIFFYFLAVLLGMAAGLLQITIGDLLVVTIFVVISTLVLGYLRPPSAWRWALVVGIFVPLFQLAAYLLVTQRPYRAQVWGSLLGLVTAVAGAYLGVFARKGIDELFRSPH